MEIRHKLGVADARAALVSDEQYGVAVRDLVRGCVHRCLASLFIVDPTPANDGDLVVDALLHDLAGAQWRGADVRLLIGGSRENGRIRDATLLGRARAQQLGVEARLLAARDQRSDHTKVVVVDDTVLVGSHNWSAGALTGQTQDSVLIQDRNLAAYFTHRFESRWRNGLEGGFHVSR